MKGKIGSGGAPLQTITSGGNAEIIVASEEHGLFGAAGLLARAIANHECGLPGRCA